MDLLATLYSYGSLNWWTVSYAGDWVSIAVLWAVSWLVRLLPVFEREFSVHDLLINYPHKSNTVSSVSNKLLAIFVPMGCMVLVGLSRKSRLEVYHGIASTLTSVGLAQLITRTLKHRIGRLRPDFLARCKWDVVAQICTGNESFIIKGRKSFPSGHSSTAFSGFALLAIWSAEQLGAWAFSRPMPVHSWKSTRLGRLLLTLIPISWATFVALSRMSDYRHHKEDIIVGSLIGIATSIVSYFLFWPNPFSGASHTNSPTLLYSNPEYDQRYEFSSQDDLPGTV